MNRRSAPPHTPDGRYFVVVGTRGPRLWRASNPQLDPDERARWTGVLMAARRALRHTATEGARAAAREQVQAAKVALSERGPVWWDDSAPDLNRRLVEHTCYAQWWAELSEG